MWLRSVRFLEQWCQVMCIAAVFVQCHKSVGARLTLLPTWKNCVGLRPLSHFHLPTGWGHQYQPFPSWGTTCCVPSHTLHNKQGVVPLGPTIGHPQFYWCTASWCHEPVHQCTGNLLTQHWIMEWEKQKYMSNKHPMYDLRLQSLFIFIIFLIGDLYKDSVMLWLSLPSLISLNTQALYTPPRIPGGILQKWCTSQGHWNGFFLVAPSPGGFLVNFW